MELWQRLKDLERVVASQEARIKALEGQPEEQPEEQPEGQKEAEVKRKLCPKCNRVPAYFFHVKNCRGDADVA